MEDQRLQDQQESRDAAGERLRAVTRELDETAEIVEEATTTINCLHAELRNVQEGARSSKGESVKRPEALGKMVAVWKKELNEVIHRWPKFFCAHTNCNQANLPELQITPAGNPPARNLTEAARRSCSRKRCR
jgi:hypothetical protein